MDVTGTDATGGPARDDEAAALVARIRDAVAAGDAESERLLLHPYLHWMLPDGSIVRGRTNVLALLATQRAADAPGRVELRDGQVYRWLLA